MSLIAVRQARRIIEDGRKKQALIKATEEKEKRDKILHEADEQEKLHEQARQELLIRKARNSSLIKACSIAGIMVVAGGILFGGYKGFTSITTASKGRYDQYKIPEEVVAETESAAAIKLVKDVIEENAINGTAGARYLWSKNVDDETRSECELVLTRVSKVDFGSVTKIPGQILKVSGTNLATKKPVMFLLDPSPDLSLRYVQAQN